MFLPRSKWTWQERELGRIVAGFWGFLLASKLPCFVVPFSYAKRAWRSEALDWCTLVEACLVSRVVTW